MTQGPPSPRPSPPGEGAKLNRSCVLSFDRAAADMEKRVIELSFSSEEPVSRYWGVEILDHRPGSVQLGRLKGSGPLLLEHDRAKQIGVIEDAWLDGSKARARVRFGRGALATEIFNDVMDGIRANVSTNYDLNDVALESEKDGVPTYRVRSWTPNEISIVAVPADPTVGVGRGEEQPTDTMKRTLIPNILLDPAAGGHAGGGGGQGAPAAPPATPASGQRSIEITSEDRTRIHTDARREERKRINDITSLYAQHRCAETDKDGSLLKSFLDDGSRTPHQMQAWILENRYNAAAPIALDPNIGMTRREVRRYSVINAIRLAAENGGRLPKGSGIEYEAHEAARARYEQAGMAPQGFMIPNDVLATGFAESKDMSSEERSHVMNMVQTMRQEGRALSANTPSTGGYLVDDTLLTGNFIELLRNAAVVRQLGPTVLGGLTGPVRLPRQVTAGTAAWYAELASITAADPTFGQLTLAPKRIGGGIDLSKELMSQSSISVEAFARQELATVIAIGEDVAFIAGNGGNQPLGILLTTGVGSVTFGAAPTWAKVVEFEQTTETANALIGSAAWLSNPTVKGKWKTTVKVASQAVFLLEQMEANGYPFNSTNQITTGAPFANRVIFGVWSDAVIAEFAGLDIVVDPYTGARTATVQVTANAWRDFGIRHPAAFTISSDSGAQ